MKLALAGTGAFLLHVATLHTAPWVQDDLLYDEIAQRWLKANEVQDAKTVTDALHRAFTHLSLGVFDVYVPPAALKDAKALEDARVALLALVEAQRTFARWAQGTADEAQPEKRKDDALAKWLSGLTPKAFAGRAAGGADMAEAAGAEQAVRSALDEFRGAQRKGGLFGVGHDIEGVPLALFPRRGEFVEFTCVAGSLDPALRPSAWQEGLTNWLEYQADGVPFVTLEYTAGSDDFQKGVSVGARNPAALAELVAQVAGRAMLAHVYSRELDPALASGVANALVIDLYGELDTRIDGDVRARSSQGRSMFVPGGNPDGGVLPPTSAESRWRGTKGKDHFVGILSQVQKQSGKKAQTRADKLTRFELQSDDGGHKALVSAPFLGPKAVKPDPAVFGDYLELVRCYGVAFLHWLRIEGAGKPAESATHFGEFLRALGRGASAEELPRVLQGIYGQPLSAEDAQALFESPTLEGRFLAWLGRKG